MFASLSFSFFLHRAHEDGRGLMHSVCAVVVVLSSSPITRRRVKTVPFCLLCRLNLFLFHSSCLVAFSPFSFSFALQALHHRKRETETSLYSLPLFLSSSLPLFLSSSLPLFLFSLGSTTRERFIFHRDGNRKVVVRVYTVRRVESVHRSPPLHKSFESFESFFGCDLQNIPTERFKSLGSVLKRNEKKKN